MRREAGVVKKSATAAQRVGFRIEADRDGSDGGARAQIDNANRLVKPIEHVEQIARGIQGQTGRALAHCNARLHHSLRIEYSNLCRTGGGDVEGAIGSARYVGRLGKTIGALGI